jgi:hypothetical protein
MPFGYSNNPKGNPSSIRKASIASAALRRLPYPYPRKFKDLYRNMIDRCYNPSNKRWAYYGGKGVRVCTHWYLSRRVFYKWLNDNGYQPELQIDRINVNGHYSPENCRLVDRFVQQNNTTRNHYVTWKGKTQTIAQWAREMGVHYMALQHRFSRKWDLRRAMTQPFGRTIRVRA